MTEHRDDDFHPADWDRDLTISDDFVDRTLDRVLADRAEIEAEAERVEEVTFPDGFLDQLTVPEPSADFADRVVERVEADQREEWERTLESYAPPAPTEDFVERTLSALRIDRSPLRLVPSEESPAYAAAAVDQPPQAGRNLLRLAGLAAASVALAAIGFWSGNDQESVETVAASPELATQRYTPVEYSTRLGQLLDDGNDDLHFQPAVAYGGRR